MSHVSVYRNANRIFMLFGAVDTTTGPENFSKWRGQRSEMQDITGINWAKKIGLDVAGLRDETTFRAMEWGGMEVHNVEERRPWGFRIHND